MALLSGQGRAHHGEILSEATKLAENGQLVPRVDPREFTLSDAHHAHSAITDRKAAGKVVISVR
jgi:NADPH2:quinone reductase